VRNNYFIAADLGVTTLFGTNRAEALAATSQKHKGHSFWTHEEKELFRFQFPYFLKTKRKPNLALIKNFLENYMTSIYPMFRDSFRDFRIQRSVYDCIRNIIKKRQHPKPGICYSSEVAVFGPLAVFHDLELKCEGK
jgi:hypothetical protein